MGLLGFIPEIWAGEILTNLRDAHVYGSVANRNYEGEIKAFGDVVRINQIGTVNISSYTRNSTTLTRQKLDSGQKQLKVDQAKYFDFDVDDIDASQAKPKIMQAAMQEAAWGLRDASDAYIAGLHGEALIRAGLGTEAVPINITSVNIVEYLGLVSQKMDEANVPQETRFGILSPWMIQKLVLAKITLDTNNSETLTNGFVGRAMGFDLYVSNNVPITTKSTNAKTKNTFGYSGSITFAEQLLNIEAFRPHDGFEDALKGLYTYGCKIVRPDTYAVLTTDYTAEP